MKVAHETPQVWMQTGDALGEAPFGEIVVAPPSNGVGGAPSSGDDAHTGTSSRLGCSSGLVAEGGVLCGQNQHPGSPNKHRVIDESPSNGVSDGGAQIGDDDRVGWMCC